MRKRISVLMAALLALTFLAACGNSIKADKNTVYVKKKGQIVGVTVEKFDKDYYDEDELKAYVDEKVQEYVSGHEKNSVKVDTFAVEGDVATLNINYAGYKDYAALNGVEMFVGTVPQALAAGYEFEGGFLKIEDGEAKTPAEKGEVTSDADYKVVILSEKLDVKVDGTIAYVSADYTSLAAKDTVSIELPEDARDGEELSLTYIIYK